jgi:hypothetical protein
MCAEPEGDIGCCGFASFTEELKHGGADVYCVGLELWVVSEELGEKSAVSVAQDKCVAAVEKLREIVIAAAFERFAEGEVFEPAIGTGYGIEVGLEELHRGGWMVA